MTNTSTTISTTIAKLTSGGRWPTTPPEKPTIALVIRKVPSSRNSTTSGTWRLRAASRLPKLSMRSLVAWTNIPEGTGLGFASAARRASSQSAFWSVPALAISAAHSSSLTIESVPALTRTST